MVVCEGYDDFVLRTVAKEIFPKQLDSQNPGYFRCRERQPLDSRAACDETWDQVPHSCRLRLSIERQVRRTAQYGDVKPHESVVSLPPDFFRRECVYGDQGEAIFKKLQRLRDKIRNNDPQGFLFAKKVDEVNVDGIDLESS